MSTNTKHILIAVLLATVAQFLQGLIGIVPPNLQPIVTAAVGYFTHYVLENPSTSTAGAPPATPTLPTSTAATTSISTNGAPGNPAA